MSNPNILDDWLVIEMNEKWRTYTLNHIGIHLSDNFTIEQRIKKSLVTKSLVKQYVINQKWIDFSNKMNPDNSEYIRKEHDLLWLTINWTEILLIPRAHDEQTNDKIVFFYGMLNKDILVKDGIDDWFEEYKKYNFVNFDTEKWTFFIRDENNIGKRKNINFSELKEYKHNQNHRKVT
jgi:hypothetical protein